MHHEMAERFSLRPEAIKTVESCEAYLQDVFRHIDQVAENTQYRVIDAFRRHRVESRHFASSTGYGYDDEGRAKLSTVFADIVDAEDAIVSPLLMSGTHAIAVALFGLLRPGNRVVCVTGPPYDTLQSVVRGADGSLREFGVDFDVIPLRFDQNIDVAAAVQALRADPKPDLVYLQRSTGYDLRPAFTAADLGEAIKQLRPFAPKAVFLVDNCYGEFVNECEPTAFGADVIVGSMIKNPGGGLAPTGGYIAGRSALISRIGGRYSAPGVSREIGSYAHGYRAFFQGLFAAPHVVGQALKGVVLASAAFSAHGYRVSPGPEVQRGDITQVIVLDDEQTLLRFVRGVQRASAVDAHVVPYASDMPGYSDPIVMAAGTFVQGASLEMTADAPIRAPYAAYLQGGLTYEHAKLGVLCALSDVLRVAS